MGGRLFPTGKGRELGVDTDDRSSAGVGARASVRVVAGYGGVLARGHVLR